MKGFGRKRGVLACISLFWVVYLYQSLPDARNSTLSGQWPFPFLSGLKTGSGREPKLSKKRPGQLFNQSAKGLTPDVYNPYPAYNSVEWKKQWRGNFVSCMGPRDQPVSGYQEDMLMAYTPQQGGTNDWSLAIDEFETPMFGSFEDTGLNSTPCFTSNSRYLPYGYTEEDDDNDRETFGLPHPPIVTWEDTEWDKLQRECILRNSDRYENVTLANQTSIFRYAEYSDVYNVDSSLSFSDNQEQEESSATRKKGPAYIKRTAVVFQMQESREWTLDTTQYVRSMIMELALHTGGEYEIFIFIEVSDDTQPIFNNHGVYKKILERSVPREFQGLSHLFNRRLLKHWYPETHENVVKPPYTFAPLQLLTIARPDLDFFWLMDVNARYTGHHYDHLEGVASWSKSQPRHVLWETASQVYMKGVYNSWDNFTATIQNSAKNSLVRGPILTEGIVPIGPDPPLSHRGKDRWGIGEEADLITFGPIFDPVGSSFLARNEVDNFPEGAEYTPRRANAFSPMTRTSKRLLRAMHHGQMTLGVNMAPSMFPASIALHHGLKVVAFPTPIYLDATIAPERLEEEVNRPEWGRHTYDFPYQFVDLWQRMTFAISTDEQSTTFADILYKRWLGYDEKRTRGLCLPGMMLHPVRGV